MILEKRSVLIVDDEINIGILIQKLIDWDTLNLQCMDILHDGEAALECLKERRPDIVITDIKMPKMDGLDLIQAARAIAPQTSFIVISGYKEFEYAHKAIEYGVENYLLKPVNSAQLNNTLRKIQKNFEEQIQEIELKEDYVRSKALLKHNFLDFIIEQKNTDIFRKEDIVLEGDIFCGVVFKFDYVDYRQFNSGQDSLLLEYVRQIVEVHLNPVVDSLLLCEKENVYLYALLSYKAEVREKLEEELNAILLQTDDYIMGMGQYVVTVGVGSPKNQFEQIRFSVLESYQAVANRMVLGTGRLIYFGDIQTGLWEDFEPSVRALAQQLQQARDSYSAEQTSRAILGFFDREGQDCYGETTFYYRAAEYITDGFFSDRDSDVTDWAERAELIKSRIHHCYKVPQLAHLLRQEFVRCIDLEKEMAESKSAKPIRFVEEYVKEHYAEKILMDSIAEQVGLNPAYFSTLFKKETGMNFSAYLTGIRMNRAKELLTSTGETVAAIAEKVGYPDQKYFSQQFKKVVGVKPMVYRQLHS